MEVELDFENLNNFIGSNEYFEIRRRSLDPDFKCPPRGIFEYKNISLVGINGWIYNRKNEYFEFLTWFSGNYGPRVDRLRHLIEKANSKDFQESKIFIPGKTLSLLSDWATENWGHFLLDSIGKISLLRKLNIDISKFDQVLVPKFMGSHANQIIKMALSSAKDIQFVGKGTNLDIEYLTVPMIPGYQRTYSADGPNYFKSLISEVENHGINYYIPRTSSPRRFYESRELQNFLQKSNFSKLIPIEEASPFNKFSSANTILGVHGAALSGIVFSPKESMFFEIQNKNHAFPYFQSLAISMGQKSEIITYESSKKLEAIARFKGNKLSPRDYQLLVKFFEIN